MKVVCAAIIRNEKIGIAKRKSKISNGIYEFPGGKVEDNETEIEALKREIKEECGIEIENIQFFMKNKDFQEEEIDLSCFVCTTTQEPVLSVHTNFIWTTPDKIYDYPFFESDRCIVEKLIEEWPCLKEQMKIKY
ncbi:MAG: NUDIX domain-containing protein [Floccifex porci]|uniref:8-oxo-dGTP diphosphatase n=1 Tax=Floccifex porci TaxID=2606629 RepID=A0A7X2T3E0_9FIRM|nr:NUDIX domain-containing protein [Floccifex porci]MCI7802332.1 NUDIX domain-containing protein [Erysipelotrichaceae bacterium]MDD7467208.1 NUDIX domain-containing protein [Floccifex porci]MDO4479963.1 NUDIX domain-containing protein [Erysipelotrichaceae bacterium]MDY4796512.1 NUDIX domain-containing protein [Floccifex porci]MSS00903.1 NUDIX domain-containing protein [Floccifex porci]